MKKIVSFLIIAAMVFSTLPVFATEAEPAVTLAYLKDGESYEAGSAVILGAKTDIDVDVARVDFYANGIKIPGCITSTDKTLNWTIPTSGSYEIYAKLTTTGGAAPYISDSVTINGVATEKPFLKFDTADDVAQIYGKNYALATIPKENANSEFVKKSNFSAPFGPMKGDGDRYFAIKGLNVNIGTSDNVYLNYLMYASNDIVLRSTLTDYVRTGYPDVTSGDNNHTRPNSDNRTNGFIPLKAGWNMVSVDVRANISNGYYAVGTVIDNINEISFTTYQNNITIPSDTALYGENAGKTLNAQIDIENTIVYLDSAWVSSAPMSAPKAISSIPSGSTKVCNGLDKITLTFDQEMDFSALSDGDITVTDAEGTAVENFSLTPSTNAMVIDFAESNPLEYDKTYTVTLSDNVKSFYGKSVDSTTKEFTFSTIQSCETVEPIVSLTYPAASATVTADNATLAAKVIFGGTVSKVEFYEGDTKLADGTKGAEGEWYATDVALSAGTHYVKSVVTYGDGATTDTDAVSFSVSDALNYTLTGIFDGEVITLNTSAESVVSRTVGITPVEGVSKVVYKVDGVETATVTTSPFTWNMPIKKLDQNVKVSAEVYSVGVTAVPEIDFMATYIGVNNRDSSFCSDFDSEDTSKTYTAAQGVFTTFSNRQTSGKGGYTLSYVDAAPLGRTGNVAKLGRVDVTDSTNKASLMSTNGSGVTNTATGLNPRVKFSFDFYLPSGYTRTSNDTISLRGETKTLQTTICDLSKVETDKWHTVVAYLDMFTKTITCDIDGETTVYAIDDSGVGNNASEDAYSYLVSGGKANISFASFYDIYIDNLTIGRVLLHNDSVLEAANKIPTFFVNGIKKDVTASGETVNVSVANLTAADSTVSVLFALYNDDNEMIAVWTEENVSVKSNELSQTIQNVPYTVNGKTGTIVKAFCWNNMGEIKPVQTIR